MARVNRLSAAQNGFRVLGDAMIRKTPPDARDNHVHASPQLDGRGNGMTAPAGQPTHRHRVRDHGVVPMSRDGYTSDHKGRIAR